MRNVLMLTTMMMAKRPSSDAEGGANAAAEAPAAEAPAAEAAQDAKSEAAVEVGQTIIKKITPKEMVVGKLTKLVIDGVLKLPCDLYTLIGRAHNLRDGESDFGPWTALVGEFEGTRIYDGSHARFLATESFIPGPAGDLLIQQMRKLVGEEIAVTSEEFKKHGKTYKPTGEFVELAVIVGVKLAEREGGAPYEYTVRPVVPVQKSDSLASLRQKMLVALPAPKK